MTSTQGVPAKPPPAIVSAWNEHAEALADWTLTRVVVRKDVYGITLPDGRRITGHDSLTRELLIRHYQGLENIGAHLISPDNRCLCLVADVDAHDDKADPETNWQCVNLIVDTLGTFELGPLVCDSNGKGGYHVRASFKKPIAADVAFWLAQQIKSRLETAGLPNVEIFPKQGEVNMDTPYGNWVRLPGKHPKREHYTRIYDSRNDRWLEGEPAVKALLHVAGDDVKKLLAAFKAAQPATEARKGKKGKHESLNGQADEAVIRSALFHCPNNDLDYDPWIARGFALNDWDPDRGLELWIEWSKQSSKHVEGECERRWASMAPGGGITAKSIFGLAIANGWDAKPSPNGDGDHSVNSVNSVSPPEWAELSFPEMPDAETFPVDVFPIALQRYCRDVAKVTLAPVDIAGCAMLATASAAIGQSVNISAKRTWSESPLLYMLVVAAPGKTKSPVLKLVVRPLTKIDAKLRKESEDAKRNWEDSKKTAPKGVGPGPSPPQRRAVVKDITRETLVAILRDNPRGVLADPDEATAWVASFNEYKAKGSDRQFWLSIWGSQPISVDREGGNRSAAVANPLVTVMAGLQPDMIGALSEQQGRNDGFRDRILFSFPEVFPKQRWTEDELDSGDETTWFHVIGRLHSLDMSCKDEEVKPYLVCFDNPARRAWIKFFDSHCEEMEGDDFPCSSQGFWSKLRAYALRFALILSRLRVAMNPEVSDRDLRESPVSEEDVHNAGKLVTYFKSHLSRVEHRLTSGMRNQDSKAILDWIRRKVLSEFSERDLKRDFPKRFPDHRSVVSPLAILAEANAIRLKAEPPAVGKRGRKPTPTWEVNPILLDR